MMRQLYPQNQQPLQLEEKANCGQNDLKTWSVLNMRVALMLSS